MSRWVYEIFFVVFFLLELTKNNKKYIFRTFSLLFYLNNYSNIIYMEKQNETKEVYVKLLLAKFEQYYNLGETDEAVVEYLKRYRSVICCRRKNNYHERAKKLCCLAYLQSVPRTYKDVLNSLVAYLYKWKNSEEFGGETRLYNLTGIYRPITEGERLYSEQVCGEYQLEKLCKFINQRRLHKHSG